MARTQRADFAAWFAHFLPGADNRQPASLFEPAVVSDRSDGKIAHLDGLNLSRRLVLAEHRASAATGGEGSCGNGCRRASRRRDAAHFRRLYGRALAREFRLAGAAADALNRGTSGAHQHSALSGLVKHNRWIEQVVRRHADGILWRAAAIALMLNLVLVPNQFPPASLAIGRAYTYRFWHPAAADEWIDIGIAILIWPIGIVLCALWFTRQNGPIVASRFGRSVARQFADQLRLAVTSGLLPAWYYSLSCTAPAGCAAPGRT